MPLLTTKGAASATGLGFSSSSEPPNFIEDVFSCFLYTGNGSTQTINNGIDLAGKGGLVWSKDRGDTVTHQLFDSVRGTNKTLSSATTNAQGNNSAPYVPTFLSTGFETSLLNNENAHNFVSWTFRKQPKFFDVVTYTGTGIQQSISHNLGSTPGFIVTKSISSGFWRVWTNALTVNEYLTLNASDAKGTFSGVWGTTAPNSTSFQVGTAVDNNSNGQTFVAYLFAHDAGGFGLSGTDNVISCGSFTTDGSGNATVNLGYEPQWALIKKTTAAQDWVICDTMRGWNLTTNADKYIATNTNSAESNQSLGTPTATGFSIDSTSNFGSSSTFIYIAIRRGPMKVPTLGTSVFTPAIRTGTGTTTTVTGVGFSPDAVLSSSRNYPAYGGYLGQFYDRLRGAGRILRTPETAAEVTVANAGVLGQDGYTVSNSSGGQNDSSDPFVDYSFKRAPSFFDEVCYTGNSASGTAGSQTINHNLGVSPEFGIFKSRNTSGVWVALFADTSGDLAWANLNSTNASVIIGVPASAFLGNATTFTARTNSNAINANSENNISGVTYVAYLFATCASVSKVGSYTGNGTSQTIPCGFTSGARFVLIKKSSGTGDWIVSDSARGIVAGSDPYLELNNTNAEVAGEDWLDTDSTGFVVNEVSGSNANTSGATYIFLAIA